MSFYELNLDGLVGQTHHYAGLAKGNIASTANANSISNPRDAALQGLAKMRFLHEQGFKQGILPPHQRPNLKLLFELGFTGKPAEQLNKASQIPQLLSAAYSASPMWTANAATISASIDSFDSRVQFTTANLISNLHRHHEAPFSKRILERIFNNSHYFKHHPLLPNSLVTSDEGAANHSRLYSEPNEAGISFFVYGKKTLCQQENLPKRYPARQTLEASEAIARQHGLSHKRTYFACQNPKAIDEGVFHNDVIATANRSLLLVHEDAFLEQEKVLNDLQNLASFELKIVEVKRNDLSLQEAVSTYLFNSQVLSLPNKANEMLLLAPIECEKSASARAVIDEWINDNQNPISQVQYLDLKQSMRNGGGPACLRLRVPLNEKELNAMHQAVLVTPTLLDNLERWVIRHYREQLSFNDLKDPLLLNEVFKALDELSQLLALGSIYPFQCEN